MQCSLESGNGCHEQRKEIDVGPTISRNWILPTNQMSEVGIPPRASRKLSLPMPWSWSSETCTKFVTDGTVRCKLVLSHYLCGNLLQQWQKMNIAHHALIDWTRAWVAVLLTLTVSGIWYCPAAVQDNSSVLRKPLEIFREMGMIWTIYSPTIQGKKWQRGQNVNS